ncbi:YD repeat protein [Vibrio sp. RC586]|uniref:RHS repeat protein n=1 Tax=Vibrio sp. RC586 TaxID=675815 RepID=UPI0001BB83DB|nr:RHS repeat protein [Vibrio sp. RC586]EEZ00024.1 YD repeat protein [Vibrio sp. RC586]
MEKIISNAYNFSDFISSGVDPRTGSYSAQIKLLSLIGNRLNGPYFDVTIGYSMNNPLDIGFGRGWSLPLSSFDKANSTLSLRNGQQFKIEWDSAKNEYVAPYYKLKDVNIYYVSTPGTEQGEIKVVHSSGEVEFIDWNEGTLSRWYNAKGHHLQFSYWYNNSQRILYKVEDSFGLSLHIDTWSDEWSTQISLYNNESLLKSSTVHKVGGGSFKRLSYITLPNREDLSFKFEYSWFNETGMDLLTKTTYPAGYSEEVTYYERGFLMPDGAPNKYVPQVTKMTVYQGDGIPARVHAYTYSDKNYLGFASDAAYIPGEDTLFQAAQDYKYSSKEVIDNYIEIQKIYTKYHLIEQERYLSKGDVYQEINYEYYANNAVGIKYQVPQYTFLKRKEINFFNSSSVSKKVESYKFDEWGNNLEHTNETGITTVSEYKANSQGSFKNIPVTQSILDRGGNLVNKKEFTYKTLPSLLDGHSFSVLTTEKINGLVTNYHFYENRQDIEVYGKKREESTTALGAEPMRYSYTYDFTQDRIVYQVTTASGSLSHSNIEHYDYFTGQLIYKNGSDSIELRVNYDELNQITEERLLKDGSDYSEKIYKSHISSDNYVLSIEESEGETTVQTCSANGHVLSMATKVGTNEITAYTNQYDSFGRKISTTQYDTLDTKTLELTTYYEYDLYGQIYRTTYPSGVVEVNQFDYASRTHTKGIVGKGFVISHQDAWGNTILEQYFDRADQLIYEIPYQYDLANRLIRTETSRGAVIEFKYDVFDRVIEKTTRFSGKNGPEIFTDKMSYDNRTEDESLTLHTRDGLLGNNENTHATIISNRYDGFGRLIERQVNGLRYQYKDYDDSNRYQKVILPNGHATTYSYDPVLGLVTKQEISNDPSCTRSFSYNKRGLVVSDAASMSSTQYEYDALGNLSKKIVTSLGATAENAVFSYSAKGLLLSMRDFTGSTKALTYDDFGRVQQLVFGNSNATAVVNLNYDQFDRLVSQRYEDGSDHVEMYLDYGANDMESTRRWVCNGQETLRMDLSYDTSMRIIKRKTMTNGIIQTETFDYDQLGRIVEFVSSGANPPQDIMGRSIVKQQFHYDHFDNITDLTTHYDNGIVNTESRIFDAKMPTRLINIYNTHEDFTNQTFEYDELGNRINLAQRDYQLSYNNYGQLSEIRDDQNKVIRKYYYDAIGMQSVSVDALGNIAQLYYHHDELVAITRANESLAFSGSNGGKALTITTDLNITQANYNYLDGTNSNLGSTRDQVTVASSSYLPFG